MQGLRISPRKGVERMKKSVLFVLTMVLFWAFVLVGCASVVQETYPEFMVTENKELGVVELNHDGLIYRPYGVIPDKSRRGNQIGIREDDPQSKLCEVKGYPSGEWLVEYLDVFMGGGGYAVQSRRDHGSSGRTGTV